MRRIILRSSRRYEKATDLLEWVGAGSPVGEEHGETDSLEDAGKSADGNGVKRTLLGEDSGDELQK